MGKNGEFDNGYGNNGYGDNGYGNSGYGNSGYGNSGYGNSGYGNNGYGNNGYGNNGYGYSGQPYNGQPYSGNTYQNQQWQRRQAISRRWGQSIRYNGKPCEGTPDPNLPPAISRKYPDARLGTKKDALGEFLLGTLFIGFLVGLIIVCMVVAENKKAETERIMSYNVTVQGLVTDTWTEKHSSGKTTKTYHYASYSYFYEGRTYYGKLKINAGQLETGKRVTVYVDPTNPSDSRLFAEPAGTTLWLTVLMVPEIVYWIFLIRHCLMICQGRMAKYHIYSRNGYKTKWIKLSS